MSTYSNIEIESAIASDQLLSGTDGAMVEGASYQLRMGHVYYDLSEGGKRFELSAGEKILIKPGHRVVLITAEELIIPQNLVARVVSKGSLFSIGLSPVATYADPGFNGNLGIVTQNLSDKYVELPQGEPIAKVEFNLLNSTTTKPYIGQHGFQTGMWPIKTHLQRTHKDVKNDVRVFSESEEALALLPNATRIIIRRLESTLLWTVFALVIAIGSNAVTLVLIKNGSSLLDHLYAVVGSLVATGIAAVGALLINYFRRIK
ncbi:hypothetical protein AB9F26_09535 [Falsihalocynthiibacter sp. BN13B15]|jgi:dCTP deaminase|uniref:dCTP deaminase domain-containing protein n=1 Tax=Falsihalocynthiibacter sp. BN13B15 TaxID=3240871 RepID=UPI003510997F